MKRSEKQSATPEHNPELLRALTRVAHEGQAKIHEDNGEPPILVTPAKKYSGDGAIMPA